MVCSLIFAVSSSTCILVDQAEDGGENSIPTNGMCTVEFPDACSRSSYCRFEPGSCGTGVNEGICTKKPDACPNDYQPVCGCNGKTYGNVCGAAMAGINLQSMGECGTLPVLPPESVLVSECSAIQPFRDALSFEENMSGTAEIQVVGDIASFVLGWSGGCESHQLYLCWSGMVTPNQPVEILLHHNANSDPCEAYLSTPFQIDLTPIKESWIESTGQSQGSVTLTFSSATNPAAVQQSVEYTF